MTGGDVRACGVEEIFDHPSFAQLVAEAAAECANKALSPVEPDRGFYQRLEASGCARFFRCGAGDELHGFASLLIAPSGSNGQRYATVERLFVAKAYRFTGAGARLMAAIEDTAREAGCEAIAYSAHVGTALAKLMFLCEDQYKLGNYIFWRRLG